MDSEDDQARAASPSAPTGGGGGGRSANRTPRRRRRLGGFPIKSVSSKRRRTVPRGGYKEASSSSEEVEEEEEVDPEYEALNKKLLDLEKALAASKDAAEKEELAEQIFARQLDCVEWSLRKSMGSAAFDATYANRGRENERDDVDALRKTEDKWNEKNCRYGEPPIRIVDWTTLPSDAPALAKLQYIKRNETSLAAAKLIEKHRKKRDYLKCDAACTTCSSADRSASAHCCGVNDIIINTTGTPVFAALDADPKDVLGVHLECGPACSCDPATCSNWVLQEGRKAPILIFRDYQKGWTMRALTEFPEHAFILEYVGRVVPEPSSATRARYDFSMLVKIPRAVGKAQPLTICSAKAGNEGRYLPHACVPNSTARHVVVDRSALFSNRIAFYSTQHIRRGEEINFDYLDGKGVDQVDPSLVFFPYCCCGHPACRFTEATMAALKEEQEKAGAGGESAESDVVVDGEEASAADDVIIIDDW